MVTLTRTSALVPQQQTHPLTLKLGETQPVGQQKTVLALEHLMLREELRVMGLDHAQMLPR